MNLKALLIAFGIVMFSNEVHAQEKRYFSSYDFMVAKEDDASNFGFGINTTHGFKLLRYFLLSGVVSHRHFNHPKVSVLPIQAELKWFYHEIDEQYANPYISLGAGPNVKLGSSFLDGTSVHLSIGVVFELGDNLWNLEIGRWSYQGDIRQDYLIYGGYGVNFGINF